MATYNPPTENLAIFDPSVFASADIALTQATADTRYLRFPNAQGTENLAAINVNGISTFNAVMNVNSGINQTDSNYVNTTVSTGSFTAISGGSVANNAGTNSSSLSYNKLVVGDNSAGVNEIVIDNSSITYDNDTGNGDQLNISSNTTNNAILIQSNGNALGGGGIILETATAGADILLQTTSQTVPPSPSNITLSTSSANAVLGVQSSIILQTDNVFVNNGSLLIQNNPTNYTTGLVINQASANNFQVGTNFGGGTLTLKTAINNIVLTATQTELIGVITATQTTYPPTITNALGYQSNSVPYNYISTPYVAASAADTYTGQSFTIAKRGMYYISISTTYSSPTTANVLYQSSYISTSSASNNKLVGSELTATTSGITAGGIQKRDYQSFIWNVNTDATPFYLWIGNNTSGTKQNIGVGIYWTKIA